VADVPAAGSPALRATSRRIAAAVIVVSALVTMGVSGCSKGNRSTRAAAKPAPEEAARTQPPSPPPPVTITFANIAIDHPAETVPVGTTVVWTNAETTALPHNVTSGMVQGTTSQPDGGFASAPLINPGEKFEHTFTAPGTYHYYCSVHLAQMQGTITVG
jgi:plastocyanin